MSRRCPSLHHSHHCSTLSSPTSHIYSRATSNSRNVPLKGFLSQTVQRPGCMYVRGSQMLDELVLALAPRHAERPMAALHDPNLVHNLLCRSHDFLVVDAALGYPGKTSGQRHLSGAQGYPCPPTG